MLDIMMAPRESPKRPVISGLPHSLRQCRHVARELPDPPPRGEHLGRVRILAADDAPALRDAVNTAKDLYPMIVTESGVLSPTTRSWKIEVAEVTIVEDTHAGVFVRWRGEIEGEAEYVEVDFSPDLFTQIAGGEHSLQA